MQLIAAVDRNWGIGSNNNLLFHIREDLQRFKSFTNGNVLIMGRKTLESLPNGQPLVGRDTIVLTRDPGFQRGGAACCSSLAMLNQTLQSPRYLGKELFVCGGQEIYELLLPYARIAHITHVRAKRPADKFFPRLSRHPEWVMEELSSWHEENGLYYAFAAYCNLFPQALPCED